MRKIEQRAPRNRRKGVRKPYRRPEPRLNIDDKDAHNSEVMFQLKACDQFIDQVNDILHQYGTRLDREGEHTLGANARECITILDAINNDLHDFCRELRPIQEQAKAFMAEPEGEAWLWTMNTHSICESLNMLRDRYVTLFMANHNSLMLQLDN